jgi:3-oxo-5-alpha-steroid 4-dehydrogenase 1
MSKWVLLQFLLCPLVLISLVRITAPYGRHFVSGWGPAMPNRLAWFAMELPALVVIGLCLVMSGEKLTPIALVPWMMWSFHYGYRTFVFPALMRPSGKSFPILLVFFAVAFNTLNGFNNSQALVANVQQDSGLLSFNFLLGCVLFVAGFCLHFQSDRIIRNLRTDDFSGYRIPQGGWFRWISNPNYLGEMIQWAGWAILTWSWAGLAFAIFTLCNLAPRAIANHHWYLEKFPNYPTQRKVLIPGIY